MKEKAKIFIGKHKQLLMGIGIGLSVSVAFMLGVSYGKKQVNLYIWRRIECLDM